MVKKKKAKKSVGKSRKPTLNKSPKMACGQCIFYVPNKDIKEVGACFQVSGQIKEYQEAKCKGKFFKPKKAQ